MPFLSGEKLRHFEVETGVVPLRQVSYRSWLGRSNGISGQRLDFPGGEGVEANQHLVKLRIPLGDDTVNS